jgi:hypothetical protein
VNKQELTLPRRLALQMLHAAQTAGSVGVAGVVAANGEPEAFYPAPFAEPIDELLSLAKQGGRRPWGVFRYRPEHEGEPGTQAFAAHPQLLQLDAALAIKGVLQLRAWRLDGGKVVACPLQITD